MGEFSSIRVAEIREELMNKFDFSKEELANIQGKPALVALLEESRQGNVSIGDFEENEDLLDDNVITEKGVEVVTPSKESTEWSDFVKEQFDESELINGNPTVDGLRRVTELVLGPIVSSKAHVVEAPNISNCYHATVEHSVTILTQSYRINFTEAADAHTGNADLEFARYPTALASTRAEARALRKALRLRATVSAEEVTDIPLAEAGFGGLITAGQKGFLDKICQRLNVNVIKYVNFGEHDYKYMSNIPYEVAANMVQYLGRWQQDMNLIPEELKGYKSDWKKEGDE